MIYYVEDDDSIRELVLYTLHTTGFEAEGFQNAAGFWQALEKELPQLVLLDIMLPDIDGFEVCRRIRASNTRIGIIMLTARSQEMDKVTGLMTGADDYVTKPFSPAELTARVDALLRRTGRCCRLLRRIRDRIDGHGLLGVLERLPALSACRVKGRKVDAAVRRGAACVPQLLGQRGEHLGLVAHAGLLNGRAAERAELAPCIGQLPAAFLAKHGYFLL